MWRLYEVPVKGSGKTLEDARRPDIGDAKAKRCSVVADDGVTFVVAVEADADDHAAIEQAAKRL